ncbi:hypothetical protein B0T22DRAFT_180365 [Podospora appendiculata]|uniref:Uncharacterized protein n=1 Tax=Podospora appendiculata TaxID=314037 RepID=A0AAE0XBZ4_9PEZI|nr:hypothetical protein B0T22DRAFT_180365 [Podospora appendiculata]
MPSLTSDGSSVVVLVASTVRRGGRRRSWHHHHLRRPPPPTTIDGEVWFAILSCPDRVACLTISSRDSHPPDGTGGKGCGGSWEEWSRPVTPLSHLLRSKSSGLARAESNTRMSQQALTSVEGRRGRLTAVGSPSLRPFTTRISEVEGDTNNNTLKPPTCVTTCPCQYSMGKLVASVQDMRSLRDAPVPCQSSAIPVRACRAVLRRMYIHTQ